MKSIFASAVISSLAIVFVSSCTDSHRQAEASQTDTTYTVHITVKGLDSGVLLLSFRDGETKKTDTAKINHGVYSFFGKAPEPSKAYLSIQGDENYDQLSFYLENGKIEIQAAKDSLAKVVATGTPVNDENFLLQHEIAPWNEKLLALYPAFDDVDKKGKDFQDSLEKVYEHLDQGQKNAKLKFIYGHPASYVSAYEIMNIFSYNPDVQKFDSAFQHLDSALKTSSVGRRLHDKLVIAKQTDINSMAPDFTLNDVNGKPVALSSLRGKYLLIDFWASWCGPCRAENPNLVKTYKTFNKKGFEVVGVSFDEPGDRDKWIAAIKKDKLTWLQLSDLKGWESEAGKLYGIAGIPMNFLLDKEGKIIAKGLRGEELDRKLEAVLQGQTLPVVN